MNQQEKREKKLTDHLRKEVRSCLENFHNIINRSADPILIVDREGVVRFANPAAAELFARDSSAMVGRFFGFPVVNGERTEIEVVRKGRPPAVAEMQAVETEWSGESVWLATLRDVTERKELELRLKQELERSEEARSEIDAILRSVAEGLIVTDPENRIVLINHSLEIMLGFACQQVAGLTIDQVFREEPARSRVLDALGGGSGERFDLELRGQFGEGFRILQAWTSVIRDKAGKNRGSIITLQDVTSVREIERMKSEFVSVAAHDLRVPLTTIIGYSDVLLSVENLSHDHHKFLGIIRDQAFSLVDLIDAFLDVAQIESGEGIPLRKTVTTVEELVGQVDPFIQMNSDKFSFQLELKQKTSCLIIDSKRMGQVLLNLLGNAVKYSPNGGVIRIDGEASGGWYHLSIQDQGIGMKPEQVVRIFDKFYRADASPQATRGTGLGMSIVKNLIEAHEGKIRVKSEFGKGTTVRFALPLGEEERS